MKKVPLLPYLEEVDPFLFSKKEAAEPLLFSNKENSEASEVPLLFSKEDQYTPGTNTKVSTSPFLPLKLTIRICLSVHAKTYDPLGLVLPTRMIGNLLFRESLQLLKKERQGKIPWDAVIEGDLKQQWLEYFAMLLQLNCIKFPRCVKPENYDMNILPCSEICLCITGS